MRTESTVRGPADAGLADQRGFSLIEILVSAVVTAVLATSAFYFLSAQNGMGTAGNDLMKGINLGKLKMDSLKVATYGELVSGSDTVSERYIRAWHVTVMRDGMGVPNGRKKIDMNVIWPLTADHSVTLATLKADDSYREGTP
ncbi:MAG TPA: prepilin-type N-terminal cleavage/methylation domain-containing protein [Fibrobacteria bacterium]|nr:prepilin-type N-terminal cleavage/methylation domain-containing protein [Fibrobacteria bacterium]